ncbi:MAG: hypothetical protein LBU07_07190 [Coriobacteriales bacterium]|jgi:YegS/Rv2252/BmrU family lipid kinase|nr:hypothetical protein [Coriobacteriales bacterium]
MDLPHNAKISLLINPGAGSGTGAKLRAQAETLLTESFPGATLEVLLSRDREHMLYLGAHTNANLIVCVSGDGSVHDLAQALLMRPPDERPALAAIPAGSGNDYALSLGMPVDPLAALRALPSCQLARVDVGQVNDTYFLETLSFGVDAAVALHSEELRLRNKQRGVSLYARAAVDAVLHELIPRQAQLCAATFNWQGQLLILAVQNGPTYGGGFKVAPSARIDDGILDVYFVSGIGKLRGLYYLLRMKKGRHERLSGFHSFQTQSLKIEFAEPLPAQCDGERLLGTYFDVGLLPAALTVCATTRAALSCREDSKTAVSNPRNNPPDNAVLSYANNRTIPVSPWSRRS